MFGRKESARDAGRRGVPVVRVAATVVRKIEQQEFEVGKWSGCVTRTLSGWQVQR